MHRGGLTLSLSLILSWCSTSSDVVIDASPTPDPGPSDPGPPPPSGPAYLEIADAPGLACGASTSPGADIDAARMFADPTLTEVSAWLGSCELVGTAACPGAKASNTDAASGASDSNGFDGFVSLNGRSLVCRWEGDARLELGRVVEVLEVGADTAPEPFQVRACHDAERASCGAFKAINTAGQTVPAGQLLF